MANNFHNNCIISHHIFRRQSGRKQIFSKMSFLHSHTLSMPGLWQPTCYTRLTKTKLQTSRQAKFTSITLAPIYRARCILGLAQT